MAGRTRPHCCKLLNLWAGGAFEGVGANMGVAFAMRLERESNLNRPAVRPVFTRLWDDPHRLELQLRARAAAIGGRGQDPACCPVCRREVKEGDGGMQLGCVAVHQACLPAARSGAGASERSP
jgi:hypothetical protein